VDANYELVCWSTESRRRAVFYVDDDEPFLTVRGANDYEPETGIVTVDAGPSRSSPAAPT